MFTGITTNLGFVKEINKKINGEYKIESDVDLSDAKIGSSILCSGICLTIVKKEKGFFTVNISEETLRVTSAKNWKKGTKLNIEKSLKVGDELGGHIVTGHIDKTTYLLQKKKLQKSLILIFQLPNELQRFVCRKGSIAIEGISLTVNDVEDKKFSISIIPHTFDITTLGSIKKGDIVNLEIDILARYVENNIKKKK